MLLVLCHSLQEDAAFVFGVALARIVLHEILALHEGATIGALDQRVVVRFERVDVELCPGCLGRQIATLAQFVGYFIFVSACLVVEKFVVGQSLLLDLRWLLDKEDVGHMLRLHVRLERSEVFKADRGNAIGAAKDEGGVQLDYLLLLIFCDNIVEELQLIFATVLFLPWLPCFPLRLQP